MDTITTDWIIDTLTEGEQTGRDGHPATYLAIQLDAAGVEAVNGTGFGSPATVQEFVDAAFDAYERITVTETTALRFASDEEVVASRLEATIERIASDARLDLEHMVAHFLIQPATAA